MFKNILLPEKIGNYYLFPQRIVSFEISKNLIRAMKASYSSSSHLSIEKYAEENIDTNVENSDAIFNNIKNILSKFDKFNYLKIGLPSSLVIFKELTFPFLDIYKIKNVLNFEIEPILPYSIEEAVIDFIITNQNKNTKQTTIFVAVARKRDIKNLIEPFKNLNLNPSHVVVDVFGLYSIYKSLPQYQNQIDQILLDIEFDFTNLILIQNGQLKLIRSLNFGISDLLKQISEELNIEQKETIELIYRFGLKNYENEKYNNIINNFLKQYINKIHFTINSFKNIIPTIQIQNIILTGVGSEIKDLCNFFKNEINLNCEILSVDTILKNKNIKSKEKNLTGSSIIPLSIIFTSKINENFNLLQKELSTANGSLLKKQIITFLILLLLLFTLLIGFNRRQTNKLTTEINKSKTEAITALKNTFNINDPATLRNLQLTLQEAKNKINEEETIWFSFSQAARFSFLKYLQELSSLIDREGIGLNLKRLTITSNLITLEGEVKDFKSLEILENALSESKLFSHVSVPQETKFTIKINIKKNEEIE